MNAPSRSIEAHLESVAREVAAALSQTGEGDWRQYVLLAQLIDERLGWQLLPFLVDERGGGPNPGFDD